MNKILVDFKLSCPNNNHTQGRIQPLKFLTNNVIIVHQNI